MLNRKIETVYTPKESQGFLGAGHTAVPVVGGANYEQTNPFIFLMDDQLDLPGGSPVGGPHPHAGIETVTLILEADDNRGFEDMKRGDMEWMTAGSGIVHGSDITTAVQTRLLQLWLILPKNRRWITPKVQNLRAGIIPVRREDGVEVRIYSGDSGGVSGPAQNETPVTILEMNLAANAQLMQDVAASYNGFLYVIEGSVEAGEEATVLKKGQVGWLDRPREEGNSQVKLRAGQNGARLVFYAGLPQEGEIVQHGPFIGNTKEDITRLYREFREGKMRHVDQLSL